MNSPVQICARCDKITRAPVVVAEIHGNSGPGWTVHACPDCAPFYPRQCDPIAMYDAIERHRRSQEENQ